MCYSLQFALLVSLSVITSKLVQAAYMYNVV